MFRPVVEYGLKVHTDVPDDGDLLPGVQAAERGGHNHPARRQFRAQTDV